MSGFRRTKQGHDIRSRHYLEGLFTKSCGRRVDAVARITICENELADLFITGPDTHIERLQVPIPDARKYYRYLLDMGMQE